MLTAEQKAVRVGKITSSVAAGALGLDEYCSPLQAWSRIMGYEPDQASSAIERGNRLEDLVLEHPVEALGCMRKPAPFISRPDMPWAGDSADALYIGAGGELYVGEGKTVSGAVVDRWGEPGTDQVPDSVLAQSYWHLIHRPDAEACIIPVLVGGFEFEFRLYVVKPDLELQGELVQQLERWHRDHIVTERPPAANDQDKEWLKKRWPSASRPTVGNSVKAAQIAELARLKCDAAKRKKQVETEEEDACNKIRQLMEDCGECTGPWGKVTWKNNKDSKVIDWQAVAEALGPDETLIRKHTKIKPGPRVLLVKWKG